MTTPAPDLPDWTAGHTPVTVPTEVYGNPTLTPGQSSPLIDVSAFTSVIVDPLLLGNPTGITIQQYLNTDTVIPIGNPITVTSVTSVPLVGGAVKVTNNDGTHNIAVIVYGFGRSAGLASSVVAGWTGDPYVGSIASQTWTVNETTLFTSAGNGGLFQGPAYVYLSATTTTLTGLFFARTVDGATQILADSGMFHTSSTAGFGWAGQIALPANVTSVGYQAKAAVTAGMSLSMTPAY